MGRGAEIIDPRGRVGGGGGVVSRSWFGGREERERERERDRVELRERERERERGWTA